MYQRQPSTVSPWNSGSESWFPSHFHGATTAVPYSIPGTVVTLDTLTPTRRCDDKSSKFVRFIRAGSTAPCSPPLFSMTACSPSPVPHHRLIDAFATTFALYASKLFSGCQRNERQSSWILSKWATLTFVHMVAGTGFRRQSFPISTRQGVHLSCSRVNTNVCTTHFNVWSACNDRH
jgi:hypothetical protein